MDKICTWYVVPKNTPLLIQNCARCKKKSVFYCSEMFRVNAQQKKLDVWLIYKCKNCDKTWNISIFTRVNPKMINKKLYEKFLSNDKETAWKYAFDSETLSKNNIVIDYSSVNYEIEGDLLNIHDLMTAEMPNVKIFIKSKYDFKLKLNHIVNKMHISNRQFIELNKEKIIQCDVPLPKSRIKNEVMLNIDCVKLREYFRSSDKVENIIKPGCFE